MPIKMTNAEIAAFIAKGHKVTVGRKVGDALAGIAAKIPTKGINLQKTQQRRDDDPYKSNTERLYAALLADKQNAPYDQRHVVRWAYEPIGLRLPDWGIYWPDFAIWTTTGKLEFHEIKGRGKYAVRDKAKAKFLDARRLFPEFTFRMIARTDSGWIDIL